MSEKKKSSVSLGPGASSLILIFVVLSMSVLGMLSLMNSRNDIRLSERSAAVVEAVYALNARAEESRAALGLTLAEEARGAPDGGASLSAVESRLPEAMTLDGRIVEWTESDELRRLDCAMELQPLGADSRAVWVRYKLTSATEEGMDW